MKTCISILSLCLATTLLAQNGVYKIEGNLEVTESSEFLGPVNVGGGTNSGAFTVLQLGTIGMDYIINPEKLNNAGLSVVDGGGLKLSLDANQIVGNDNLLVSAFDDLFFRTNGSHRMIIKKSGKIGFGTTNPQFRLHGHLLNSEMEMRLETDSQTPNVGSGLQLTANPGDTDQATTRFYQAVNTDTNNASFAVQQLNKNGVFIRNIASYDYQTQEWLFQPNGLEVLGLRDDGVDISKQLNANEGATVTNGLTTDSLTLGGVTMTEWPYAPVDEETGVLIANEGAWDVLGDSQNSIVSGSMHVLIYAENAAAFGQDNVIVDGKNSSAFGRGNVVTSFEGGHVWGVENSISGVYATAWGENNNVSGNYSTAWGSSHNVASTYSTAWGNAHYVAGTYSTAWGLFNSVSGPLCTVWGLDNQIISEYPYVTMFGTSNISEADNSTVWGANNKAKSFMVSVFGRFANDADTHNGTSWIETEPLLLVGNGTDDANRSNALELLKNGNMEVSGTLSAKKGVVLTNTAEAQAGAIRWNGSDFEGYDGTEWVSLTVPEVQAVQGDIPMGEFAGVVGE